MGNRADYRRGGHLVRLEEVIPPLVLMLRNARVIAGVFLLSALSGCALLVPQTDELHRAWPADLAKRVELEDVPFFPQKDYECGPAALATTLTYFGAKITLDDLINEVYLPARQGSLQVEMLTAPRRYGMVSYRLAPRLDDLLREVAAGTPVIALQYYGVWPFSIWHYAVVVGYDSSKGELVLRSGEKQRLSMPLAVFEYTWKEGKRWAMVAVPPDRIPVTASESSYVTAVVAMERAGNPRATTAAYEAFLRRWPDNLTATIGLANSYYALGELKQAEALLRQAAERHPDSVAVLNNLAQTLSDQKRNDEALALIERAAALGGTLAAAVHETRELILRRMKSDH